MRNTRGIGTGPAGPVLSDHFCKHLKLYFMCIACVMHVFNNFDQDGDAFRQCILWLFEQALSIKEPQLSKQNIR